MASAAAGPTVDVTSPELTRRVVAGIPDYMRSMPMAPDFGPVGSRQLLRARDQRYVVRSAVRENRTIGVANNPFVVNTNKALSQAPVTRMLLTDVQIPTSQLTIEPKWSRIYFDQGLAVTGGFRGLSASVLSPATGGAVRRDVLLPTYAMPILQATLLSTDGWVGLLMHTRAPTPLSVFADVFRQSFEGSIELTGIASETNTLPPIRLTSHNCRTSGVTSIAVYSPELAELYGLAAEGDVYPATPRTPHERPLAILHAARVPSPTQLTDVLSAALSYQFLGSGWSFRFRYSPLTDKFSLTITPTPPGATAYACGLGLDFGTTEVPLPAGVPVNAEGYGGVTLVGATTVALQGEMMDYMGFGTNLRVDVPAARNPTTIEPRNTRSSAPFGFVTVAPNEYTDVDSMVGAFNSAFDYIYYGTDIDPPNSLMTITVGLNPYDMKPLPMPIGRYTPQDLAETLQAVLNTGFPAVEFRVEIQDAPVQGFRFFSTADPPVPFWMGFGITSGTDIDPQRLGYRFNDLYGPVTDLRPVIPAIAPPSFGNGPDCYANLPAIADVVVGFDALRPGLANFDTRPFPAETITGLGEYGGIPGRWKVTTGNYVMGLQPGASVILRAPDGSRTIHGVVATPDGDDLGVFAVDTFVLVYSFDGSIPDLPIDFAGWLLAPQDKPPLSIYVIPTATVQFPVWPNRLGLAYQTVSDYLGTILGDVFIDVLPVRYVLIGVEYNGNQIGNVLHPLPNGVVQKVFAQIVRAQIFRTDLDKFFEVEFPGEGAEMSNFTVAVYNPDGSFYETHGQELSITLQLRVHDTLRDDGLFPDLVDPGPYPDRATTSPTVPLSATPLATTSLSPPRALDGARIYAR